MEERAFAPQPAMRVGLLGGADANAAAVGAALDRLAAQARSRDPAAALRLLCPVDAGPPPGDERPDGRPDGWAGWQVHRVSGTAAAASATLLALDHDPARPDAAWAAAAACIVRNCDVLLAIGGAREERLAGPVQQATELGIPVLWMPSGAAPRVLLDRDWQWSREAAPEGEAAWESLAAGISAMLGPPAGSPPAGSPPAEKADAGAALLDATLPPRPIWNAHRWAMNALWRMPARAEETASPPAYWAALYGAADRLASGYADRYRSSYTLVLALAAMALAAAVLGLGLPKDELGHASINPYWTALPEAAFLGGIIVLVRASARHGWQSRMIACRLLAELCRKQAALSRLARSLPASRIAPLTQDGDLGWVGRLFAAFVRAAPLPSGVLAGTLLAAARDEAAAILLRGQRAYHAARAEACRRREDRLVRLGGGAFVVTVACVAIKLGLLVAGSEWAEISGLVAALLPAFAAAFFGVRAYAELELLGRHSERMMAVLDEAARSLGRTDTALPGASQHIGDVLEEAATAMLADIEGWIQISRVKAVEAG